ncbi:uncharacterized protein LOC143174341 [Nomia melanderi]|uniref:uncharacterized protein LOC143174341 n=1 Tax=Nomia melanderi TaxID=2448451 RepID=UPI003FCE5AA9
MEYFRSFLRVIGLLQPMKVDFISELPPEVSQLILRKLDPKSLLCAAQVSRKWLDVCGSDRTLRRTARHYKQCVVKRLNERFVGDTTSGSGTAGREKVLPPQVEEIVPRVRINANVALRRLPRRLPTLMEDKLSAWINVPFKNRNSGIKQLFLELAKEFAGFPHCTKSHNAPTFLPLYPDASSAKGHNREDIKRINGLSVFIGATEQRVPVKEQQKINKLKDITASTQQNSEYRKWCKSIRSSNKKKSLRVGPIFSKKGEKIVFNFKHFVNPEQIVAEYARVNIYDKPRLVKADRKESTKLLSTIRREKNDSKVEKHKVEQSLTCEKTQIYSHSTESKWRLNKVRFSLLKQVYTIIF